MTKIKSFINADSKKIIKKFEQIIKANKKSSYMTHIIEYIFTENDLDDTTYHDMFKLFSSNKSNTNCIIDLMMITRADAAFIHMERDVYEIKHINKKHFFLDKTFERFIAIAKKNQENHKKVNSIFVFGGHCDGWYCYCEKYVVNFNMIKAVFKKYDLYFDLICFDSCYTSSLEIIYQFNDVTKYMMTHQMYVNYEGFNSHNVCKIYDSSLQFKYKLLISAVEYLSRTVNEKEYSSITIVDCREFSKFYDLYKIHYKAIREIIEKKSSEKYLSDPCKEWLSYCKQGNKNNPSCNDGYCNNMLDLYHILLEYGNNELIKIYDRSIVHKNNGVEQDKKFFKHNIKFKGINVVVDPYKNSKSGHYERLNFYRDFVK